MLGDKVRIREEISSRIELGKDSAGKVCQRNTACFYVWGLYSCYGVQQWMRGRLGVGRSKSRTDGQVLKSEKRWIIPLLSPHPSPRMACARSRGTGAGPSSPWKVSGFYSGVVGSRERIGAK